MENLATKIGILLGQPVKRLKHRLFNNFIFIHINKTAGTSIRKALNLPLEHKKAREKIEELGRREWEKRFTFTVVRNPWDKVVSHYHYRVQTNKTGLGKKSISFQEWVRLTYGKQHASYYDKPKMFMPQSDWISNREGEIIVDYTCRFENLKEDFSEVCDKIGKPVPLPHFKKSGRGNYCKYYDRETREIVEKWFEKDLHYFGYQF